MDLAGDSPSATKTGRSVPIRNFPATKHLIGFEPFKTVIARLWSRKVVEGVAEGEEEAGEDEEAVEDEEEAVEDEEEAEEEDEEVDEEEADEVVE